MLKEDMINPIHRSMIETYTNTILPDMSLLSSRDKPFNPKKVNTKKYNVSNNLHKWDVIYSDGTQITVEASTKKAATKKATAKNQNLLIEKLTKQNGLQHRKTAVSK